MTDSHLKLEEMRCRAMSQVHLMGQFESKAGRALQFVFTITSIALASVSVLYSLDALDQVITILERSPVDRLSSKISSAYPLIDGEIFVHFLMVACITSIVFLIIFLVVRIPYEAYHILAVSDVQGGVEAIDRERPSKQTIEEAYERIISKNEEAIQEAQERWNSCHQSLAYSLLSTVVFGFTFYTLYLGTQPVAPLIALLVSIMAIFLFAGEAFPNPVIQQFFNYSAPTWVYFVLLVMVVSLAITPEFGIHSTFIPILIYISILSSAIIGLFRFEIEETEALVIQAVVVLGVDFVLLFIFLSAAPQSRFNIIFLSGFLVMSGVLTGALFARTIKEYEPHLASFKRRVLDQYARWGSFGPDLNTDSSNRRIRRGRHRVD